MVPGEQNIYEAGDAPSKDWFLQFLVNLANHDQFEVDLTLTVGGFLISGTLIGVRKYFDAMGHYFTDSLNFPVSSDEIRGTFQKIGEQCSCVSPSEKTETPSYIHLMNVRFYDAQGNAISTGKVGEIWRGRISEVQGFSPGVIS